ncbi:hypothetical protein PCANC_05365 [Puccinia coronata f. sp. avenae]|uniref:Uncharacterized protein n=1 Tax=Puccinia coronata f. sp. avenae TaxID=200324 RepID=A0A2N5VXA4_9BASI|nr:hypothetical protein PCANC_05365 [Puccinia coronata f. sp. avenae]
MSYGIPPNQTDQATAEATTQAAHVDHGVKRINVRNDCVTPNDDNTDKKRGKRTMMEKIQWTKQSHKEGFVPLASRISSHSFFFANGFHPKFSMITENSVCIGFIQAGAR